eukprot:6747059-Alexandrium_andersonii.AAC.1
MAFTWTQEAKEEAFWELQDLIRDEKRKREMEEMEEVKADRQWELSCYWAAFEKDQKVMRNAELRG